jgi:predicted PurR-regulated permease PerM
VQDDSDRKVEVTPSDTWLWSAAKLLVLILAAVAAALILWQIMHVLLLAFAAILLAVLLRMIAGPIRRYAHVPEKVAVVLAALVVALVLAGFFVLMGAQIAAQFAALVERLPELIETAEARLGISGLGAWLQDLQTAALEEGGLVLNVASYSALVFTGVGYLLVVIAAAIYLALDPKTYLEGALQLVPVERQGRARETMETLGRALGLWLLGQLAAMVLVGAFTTLGLWLLGVPSALALGVIAGLLEFVPLIGPIAAAVPAVLVALGEGATLALWVVALYVVLQQLEGVLIVPIVQQRTVDLPAVVTIFAIIAFGALFGALGVLLATPLAVVCLVLVKKLWVREVLQETASVPGEV